MNNLLNNTGGHDLSNIKLSEKDQSFMDRLDKKLADGLINQNDYDTSKNALYSKYTKNMTPSKKVETKVEEKKVETKVEEKKVETKVEEKKVEEKKVEEKKVEEKKVEEKKVEPKVETKVEEKKEDFATTKVDTTGVNEYWTKEKMENATPMGMVTDDNEMPALEKQDEMPVLDEMQGLDNQEGEVEGDSSQSRAEKKARKAFSKLGLKTFPGVKKVTIKQAQVLFIIAKPEVLKLGNSYVIFGKVQIKDNTFGGKKGFEEQLKDKLPENDEIPTLEETEKLDEIIMDEKKEKKIFKIEEKDFELMQKSVPNASKEDITAAYENNDGDVVNAILELKNKYK